MTRSAATNAGVKQQFVDFMTGFTVETTPGSAAETPDYREHLCSGMVVYITFPPGSDFDDNIAVAKRLKAEGFLPAPHFAERSGAELHVVTQFCFEAEPVIAWDRRIQAEGNRLPIYIGVPGLATIKTLLAHAKACGIGPSMRFLTRQARNVAKLMSVSAPDALVSAPAEYNAIDPDCGIAGVHM